MAHDTDKVYTIMATTIISYYGKNYRFTAQDVADMKQSILTHVRNENDPRNTSDAPKTAWRLRWILDAYAVGCGHTTKKSRAYGYRQLALYKYLTKNDLPNWQDD